MAAAVVREAEEHALEIDCARRDARGRVTHLGGPRADGSRWMLPIESVLRAAAQEKMRYFVSRGPHQLGLQVKQGQLVPMIDDGWTVRSLTVCPR